MSLSTYASAQHESWGSYFSFLQKGTGSKVTATREQSEMTSYPTKMPLYQVRQGSCGKRYASEDVNGDLHGYGVVARYTRRRVIQEGFLS